MSTPSLITKHGHAQPDRSKAISTSSIITEEQGQALLRIVTPVTLSYTDLQGHTIQLWKYKQVFAASVEKNGMTILIPGRKIHNALLPQEKGGELLQRLDSAKLKKWHFSYKQSTGEVFIWPLLIAAGRDRHGVEHRHRQAYRTVLRLRRKDKSELTPIESKLLAITGKHLREKDDEGKDAELPGARKESRGIVLMRDGKPLLNKKGNPFDHQQEVNHAQRGVKNIVEKLQLQLKSPSLSTAERSQKRRELSLASRLLDYTETYIPSPSSKKRKGGSSSGKSPATKAFQQKVQQTRLTDSYNATHQKNPILPRGATGGSIGGVACSTAYIEGMFDNLETLFEEEHFFCVPGLPDGKLPFSNEELSQILRELAIGIYTHSTIPFFSLHFNEQADQYPVIHPVYENTLVGRVISMLDYIMKGYLNGGVFTEGFIDDWHKNPDWKRKERRALEQLIDFQGYCEEHHLENYFSLRELKEIIAVGPKNILERLNRRIGEAVGAHEQESDTLKNLKGFRNSFRIIAKQNSIRKEGSLFLIDADFDVLYTIDPSPEYKSALDAHMREYGSLPASYQHLETAYKVFCERIHDHMSKLPICRDYFAMLGVINFFSGYFSTLKKHNKVPVLPAMQTLLTRGAPPLFPYLPVREVKMETLQVNLCQLIASVFEKHSAVMENYFWQMYGGFFSSPGARISPQRDAFYEAIRSELQEQIIQSTSNPRTAALKVKNSREIQKIIAHNAKTITDNLEKIELALIHRIQKTPNVDSYRTYSSFRQTVHNNFPNQWHKLTKFSFDRVRVMSELKPLEIETGEKIVGGCGMNMKQQAIRVCRVARQIFQTYGTQLKQQAPEQWTEIFYGSERKQGFVFRLPYENASNSFYDDYKWMESLLVPPGLDDATMRKRWDIEKAMEEGNREDFIALVNPPGVLNKLMDLVQRRTLHAMRDRFQRTLMHLAACLQDPFYLDTLIAKKMPVDEEDVHGYQPAHYAAMHGSISVLQLLAERGGSKVLNVQSRNGSTPLITAIQHGQLEAVRYLLSNKASFSVLLDGYNTLHCALHHGNLPIIYEVLESPEAPNWVNQMDKEVGTPLMLASELDSADLVEKMLSVGADPRPARRDGVTAMEIGIRRNCTAVVDLLFKQGIDLSPQAIEIAAKQGSVEMLELLIPHPLFYSYQNGYRDTALHIAIRHGNIDGAHVIIKHCPQKVYFRAVNNGRELAFSLAAILGAGKLIEELDRKDALSKKVIRSSLDSLLRADFTIELKDFLNRCELNARELEKWALRAAQVGNYLALSFEFLPRGVKEEALVGPNGWTLAHYLAKFDGIFLFRKIMKRKGDILLPLAKEGGKTLPYIASENKSLSVLRMSLQQMKQENAPLDHHFRDRHLFYAAVETGDIECVQVFLNAFSDRRLELVNIELDDTGLSAVLLAAKIGSLKLLRLFINEGANVEAEDRNGDNALCHALRAGASNVISYLLEEYSTTMITSRALFIAAAEEDETFFIKMIGLNRSQKHLDHASFLAVQAHKTEAFSRLRYHGASSSYIAEDGSTCLSIAQATRQGNILRMIQPEVEEGNSSMTQLIAQARNKKEIEQVIRVIQSWPPNEVVQIEHEGKLIWGTPLQLLLRMNKQILEVEIVPLLRHPELDVNVQDSDGNTLVHLLLGAEILLSRSTKINWKSSNHLGQSPLHIAAMSENPRILDFVLRQPVEIDARDHQDRTPLFYAIASGQLENVNLLLSKGADVNVYDIHRRTPLTMSYLGPNPSLSILKCLLAAGANPNWTVTVEHVSPLALALHSTSDEFARCLLFNGADCKMASMDQSLLHKAAGTGKSSLLNLFVAKGLSLGEKNEVGMLPIHVAAREGEIETVKAIHALYPGALNATVETTQEALQGVTPLHMATLGNQSMMAQFLLQKYVDLEAKTQRGENAFSFGAGLASKAVMKLFSPYKLSKDPEAIRFALERAIDHDNVDIVIDLYSQGISIDSEITHGITGIQRASLRGSLQTTQWLLQSGADPFRQSPTGEDSFQIAASHEFPDQFKLLLEYAEPDLDELRNDKETLLHTAARTGGINHVAYLIKNFANINIRDVNGHLPIHVAIKNGHHSVVKLLLACGTDDRSIVLTDFVARDDEIMLKILRDSTAQSRASIGDTPLHIAIRSGNLLAILLMIYTEDINQKNSRGETPLDLAERLRNQEARHHLINAGAEFNIREE